MKLVLQCAMCGTHHPVGTPACSTCRASGVTQLRLMFECQSCGRLDLNPTCATCPPAEVVPGEADPFVLDLDDGLIVAEEIVEDPFALAPGASDEFGDLPIELDDDGGEDEIVVELDECDPDDSDSDFEITIEEEGGSDRDRDGEDEDSVLDLFDDDPEEDAFQDEYEEDHSDGGYELDEDDEE